MIRLLLIVLLLPISHLNGFAQNSIALLKYGGGGDWYANPTSLPHLVTLCNHNLKTNLKTEIPTVEVRRGEFYQSP
ncbi:MAG: DUF4159 domain-containing protein, partial [Chitinophagales bacterium]